ncbi:hypothetical protein [Costertonia aggregata]|uniref:Type II secretion system protein GspC N-terminal domain-containing protein n=1 Tax=Costertonia aggregata TaxID=343403 RepID=A0A7H9ATN8_9FLAO|nr:hypothetical protein [Costertonia aggregata]QLG46786.1 hypothetical protein HYG79_15985 [Costertonia aggregata]
MKKQTKTYLLLVLVIIIWGIIAVKIITALSSDNTEVPTVQNIKFKPKKIKPKDTFSIMANYRDPFFGTVPKAPKKKIIVPEIVEENTPKNTILYTGYVTDNSTKQKIFFVTINGQQHLMKPKYSSQGITLIKGSASQIRVRSNGKIRTIPIQQ